MRDNPKATVINVVLGVVLLGGLFVFTVVVPDLGDDPEPAAGTPSESASAPAQGPIDLPDKLSSGLVAVDLGNLPDQLAQQFGDLEALKKQEGSIADGLEQVFGVPGAFRVYAAEDGSAIAQMTALDKAPGLFTPDALPIDPEVLGVARAASELVEVEGATCSLNWGEEVPAGQAIDPAQDPQAIRCQLGAGERTYELTAQGLPLVDAVGVLKDLAGQ
ncbi:hypothetical protein [Nocardioides sp.]|uniref:hypothetical protein n=1 Tax=Nocardioides sp. TaxID=35761 RepID=UPI00271EB3CD|nr:hypothetical protein [Nocardioides sp.]MDO9457356.1 hypothetical protein [Nocardioides sp.]